MAKFTKAKVFNTSTPRAETLMDKTTRVVRGILAEETEHRHFKTARLRKARLEREVGSQAEAPTATSNGAGKKPRTKAVK